MIIRILGQGKYDVADTRIDQLNTLDACHSTTDQNVWWRYRLDVVVRNVILH